MRVERRTLQLAGVLVALIAVAVWSFGGGSPAVTTSAPRAAAAAKQAAVAADAPIDVRIERLTEEKPEPAGTGRNPFQFRAKRTAMPAATGAEPGGLFGGMKPEMPTGPPPAPPITLKYIGLVEGTAGLRVAVLSDGRSAPMYGKQGEIVDGRYRIVSIGVESIELEHLNGQGRQTIRLTGQ